MTREIILMAIIIPVSVHSQVISLKNSFRQNDVMKGFQIDYPQFNTVGTDIIWDVSEWMKDNSDEYIVRYDGIADMGDRFVAVTEQDTRYAYCIEDNSLLLCGFENHISKIDYDLPECYLKFPMFYGDSIDGYFHGQGRYCDRLSLRHYGKYKTTVEGRGCIVIADGDTLKNVICLHTERIMSIQLADNASSDSLSAYSEDSITSRLITDTDLIRTDIYRWYSDGYRYPIIEARTRYDSNIGNVVSSAAYYYPPSDQALLTNDPANEQIRVYSQGGYGPGGTVDESFPGEDVFIRQQPYSLTLCDDGQHAILKYLVPKEAMVSYALYTLEGYLLSQSSPQQQAKGFYAESISLQGTSNGVYLLDIYLGDERLTKKLILRKK